MDKPSVWTISRRGSVHKFLNTALTLGWLDDDLVNDDPVTSRAQRVQDATARILPKDQASSDLGKILGRILLYAVVRCGSEQM